MSEWRGTGHRVYVPGDRLQAGEERLDRELEYAEKAGTHVWLAMAGHLLTDDSARQVLTGSGSPTLDTENLVTVQVGCYRCEQPLLRTLVGKRCPGEPS